MVMKTTPFLCLLISSLIISMAVGNPCQPPTEFLHTLPDLSKPKVQHCSSLPATQRHPCELSGAIDAQGDQYAPTPTATVGERIPPPPAEAPAAAAANHRFKSCKFRDDNVYSLYPYAMPSSPVLNRVMEKYTAMHRRCTHLDFTVLNNDVYNYSSNDSHSLPSPFCRYLLWRGPSGGLGNRLLSLVSAFLYSIVSARVLLIEFPQYDDLFCDPFNGSTIHIPPATKLNPQITGQTYLAFRDARCGGPATNPGCTSTTNTTSLCNASLINLQLHWQTPSREHEAISCPTGYARLRNVPFVFLTENNIYLVPGFYLNPLLSPLLDILFPQRNPFHLLSRFLLVPNDGMWTRISSSFDPYASRRIGVQVREFQENVNRLYTDGFDANILNSIRKKGGLLQRRIRQKNGRGDHVPAEHVSIYMATLVERHLEVMASNLGVLTNLTGEEFRLSFQKLDGQEVHDVTHQQEALVDIWVLSFSHVLFTSRKSTFGYIATALSGTTTTLLAEEAGDEGCYLGVGSDPCFLAAPMGLSCVEEESVTFSAQEMIQNFSKIKVCPNNWGWALVPENAVIA